MRKLVIPLLMVSVAVNVVFSILLATPPTPCMTVEAYLNSVKAAETRGRVQAQTKAQQEAEAWAAQWRAAQASQPVAPQRTLEDYLYQQKLRDESEYYREATKAIRDQRAEQRRREIQQMWGGVR
jgi:hypothetical protein